MEIILEILNVRTVLTTECINLFNANQLIILISLLQSV